MVDAGSNSSSSTRQPRQPSQATPVSTKQGSLARPRAFSRLPLRAPHSALFLTHASGQAITHAPCPRTTHTSHLAALGRSDWHGRLALGLDLDLNPNLNLSSARLCFLPAAFCLPIDSIQHSASCAPVTRPRHRIHPPNRSKRTIRPPSPPSRHPSLFHPAFLPSTPQRCIFSPLDPWSILLLLAPAIMTPLQP